MIYPDVKLEDWINRYKLLVVDYSCPKCGGNFPTDIPVILRDCAGLESRIHDCGNNFTEVILVPRTPAAASVWGKIFGFRY